jgi:hypothetical protein
LGGFPRVDATNFSGIGYMQWSLFIDAVQVPRISTSTQLAFIAATARLYAAVVIVMPTEIIMLYAGKA